MPLELVVSFRGLAAVVLIAAMGLLSNSARGQGADPNLKVPPPEDLELKDRNGLPLTKDGLLIKATFYPGMRKEKSVPIIMLHGWKGNRTEFADLALFLQRDHGHAVLVPDLRGHGDSIKYANSNKTLDAVKLGPNDYDLMVADMEACKKFLMEKNNAGQLNIEKLCIIGAEMGAVVGMNWAIVDWSWPVLATGKQGQDVKALVLLSPHFQVPRGRLNMANAITNPLQSKFSVAILYGEQNARKVGDDAERMETALKRFHMGEEQTFFFEKMPTSLQGIKLLTAPGLPVSQAIATFIEQRLVEKDFPWRERTGPLN